MLCALPAAAGAQQRPLTTEDPETIGAGRILLEGGIDYARGARFPASGLEGNLLRMPLFGISIGISSIAEIQIDTGFYNRLSILERDEAAPFADVITATGDTTSDVEDVVIATKVRLLSEGDRRPARRPAPRHQAPQRLQRERARTRHHRLPRHGAVRQDRGVSARGG